MDDGPVLLSLPMSREHRETAQVGGNFFRHAQERAGTTVAQ
ncbi:hypothetical protein C7S13_3359 [Burkholderia cepacia]|nr:hypothetical protein [Burkholderia cepacia]